MNKLRESKGFTIFELIIVLAILGVLASVLYPKMQNRELAAKLQAVEMDMLRLYESCETWKANMGQTNFTGLTYAGLGTARLWDTTKTNPWGSAYSIALSNNGGPNASVTINSGAIADANVRNMLLSRLQKKGYSASIASNAVQFTAPY
jgi:prepilin-type N-terminal cleavage/methylation domain-containing protein